MSTRFLLLTIALLIALPVPAQAGCLDYFVIFPSVKALAAEDAVTPEKARTQLSLDQETLRRARSRGLAPEERQKILEDYARPTPKSVWQKALVWANLTMSGIVGLQVSTQVMENPQEIIPAVLLAPVALWLADLGGQVFHKWLDSYASETNPIWGSTARAFRQHHEMPNNLDKEDYASNVADPSLMLAPLFAGLTFANLTPEAATPLMIFLLGIMHTTEFHKQAHLTNPNPFFKFLQKFGLALSHKVHMEHHRPPFDSEFSVFLGWSSPFTRWANLWNRMDKMFWNYTGKMPHNWIQDPRSIPDYVVAKLKDDLEKIPSGLWDYGETYPTRVPAELKEPIARAKQKWQNDFLTKRREILQRKAITDYDIARTEWEEEQNDYPWLYDNKVTPLFDNVNF